jgi:hypothetical protein
MSGNDLIVLAPWLAFGVGLAVVCLLLFRARRRLRSSPAQRGSDRPSAGREAAGCASTKEATCSQHNGDGPPR